MEALTSIAGLKSLELAGMFLKRTDSLETEVGVLYL